MSFPPPPVAYRTLLFPILSRWPLDFWGWPLCLLAAVLIAAAQPTACLPAQGIDEARSVSSVFDLSAVGSNQWYRDSDFSGRPLVVVHLASWSPTTRRLLPLWQQQMHAAVSAGRIQVVAIAHEQHAEQAATLCEELGWPWLLLHDPLRETLNAKSHTSFPWASVLDARGKVIHERLTLAELTSEVLAPNSNIEVLDAEAKGTAVAKLPRVQPSDSQLLEEFQNRRQEVATFEILQPLADQLLRRAFVSPAGQADIVLRPLINFYREALHSTDDARWAFRLAVALRLEFDLSSATGRADASLWQRSLDYLELANQSATIPPAWREWLDQYRPEIDPPSSHEEPIRWPRATPVPPASIQFHPVWVFSPSAAGQGRWARLYLQVHLKRGDWDLGVEPQLEWDFANVETGSQRIQQIPQVHTSRWIHGSDSNEHAESSESISSVWLQLDMWIPANSAPSAAIESPVPPRRNARLLFQGRDPLTGQTEWRQAHFYLPGPQRSPVDW